MTYLALKIQTDLAKLVSPVTGEIKAKKNKETEREEQNG
jgi:hypothetical protein